MLRGKRLVVLLVVGLVLASAAYWSLGPNHLRRHVAVPPASATPEEVVRAYVDAMDAHDFQAAAQMVEPSARGNASLWYGDLGSISLQRISEPVPDGRGVTVAVTLDIDWRWWSSDGSITDGRNAWSYRLAREAPDEPWLIFDQGLG